MDSVKKYAHHGLPTVVLEPDEFDRLRHICSSAPGPVLGHVELLSHFEGPDGVELEWRECARTAILFDRNTKQDYLALAFYSYVLRVAKDRLCLWFQLFTQAPRRPPTLFERQVFRRNRPVKFQGLHLMLIDTRLLKPLGTIPNLAERRDSGRAPVEVTSGLIAETEFPIPQEPGTFGHEFPKQMQSMSEFLTLGRVGTRKTVSGNRDNSGIYIWKPSQNMVEVLPMDWWNKGGYDYGYEWVTKVMRDPKTRNVVGEGIRILPFLLDSSGVFLGWMKRQGDS